MSVPDIQRIKLRRVHSGIGGKFQKVDHLRGGTRFDAHGAARHPALQLLGRDGEDPPIVVARQGIALAAAATADIDADAGIGQPAHMGAERHFVQSAVGGKWGDADDEAAGAVGAIPIWHAFPLTTDVRLYARQTCLQRRDCGGDTASCMVSANDRP